MIYGNSKQQQIVRDLIENEKSPILIVGPEGVGKFSFILEYLSDKSIEKIILNPQEKFFKIDSARFIVSLSQKRSHKRIMIINEAHKFQYQSQNILLKTFEESQSNTIFILITHQQHKILPTIKSRSINVRFSLVDKEETIKFLQENNFSQEDINYALNFYPYQPGKAFKLLMTKNKVEIFKKFIARQDFDLDKLKTNFSLSEFLEYYLLFKRSELLKKLDQNYGKEINHLREVLKLYYDADFNLNFELQLTNLILNNG